MRENRPPLLSETTEGVDVGFARIVDKAIEWEASSRYPSAAAFKDALTAWTQAQRSVDELLGAFLSDR